MPWGVTQPGEVLRLVANPARNSKLDIRNKSKLPKRETKRRQSLRAFCLFFGHG
jgi:hypothetical protein